MLFIAIHAAFRLMLHRLATRGGGQPGNAPSPESFKTYLGVRNNNKTLVLPSPRNYQLIAALMLHNTPGTQMLMVLRMVTEDNHHREWVGTRATNFLT